jgi:ATP-dependent exoDNAse (exonuclease V) beta subunit
VKTFNHDFVTLPKMSTVNIDGIRYYVTPKGNRYQSVTTLTGKQNAKEIQEWRDRIGHEKANKISVRAATRGTSMHKMVENYLHNRQLNLQEENNPLNKQMFLKIQPLVDRLDKIKLIEGAMYSDELELAGTADCIAEYKDDLAVIDFKTSTRMKKKENVQNYWMQGAAYGKMYHEHYGVAPKSVILMISVETANFAQIMIEPYEKCLEMLLEFKKTI